MLENLKMEKNMVKVDIRFLMELMHRYMKGSLKMGKKMVKELSHGLMVKSMLEIGKKADETAEVH